MLAIIGGPTDVPPTTARLPAAESRKPKGLTHVGEKVFVLESNFSSQIK
jgi:hypothetical protein